MSQPIQTRDLILCLPLVASMLSKKYGVQVSMGGNTAFTNGKNINIPALPIDDENIILDARGYIDHEAAHIRFSDNSIALSLRDPFTHLILNILEDWRAEKALGTIFPGCQKNLYELSLKLWGDSQANGEPQSSLTDSLLLTVRSWLVPELSVPRDGHVAVVNRHFPGLWSQIESVLAQVKIRCGSTKDALEYAEAIVEIIKKYAHNASQAAQREEQKHESIPQEPHSSSRQGGNQDQGIEQNETELDDSQQKKNTSTFHQDNPSSSPSETEEELISSNAPTPLSGQLPSSSARIDDDGGADAPETALSADQAYLVTQALQSLLDATDDELPDDLGTVLRKKLKEASVGCTARNSLSVAQVKDKDTYLLTDGEIQFTRTTTSTLKTHFLSLLQASIFRRTRISSRGKLNSNRLYRLDYDPSIFFTREKRQSIDTAIHILLDASGSMRNKINLACLACYSTSKAMENLYGVSIGVSVFPVRSDEGIYPLVRHGERIHNRFKVQASGFTPLAESLWWVMQTMMPLRYSRKLILILTDGEPDMPKPTHFALEKAKHLGFEVFGIGIESSAIKDYLPQTSCVIWTMEDLAPNMFGILQKALLKK